VRFGGTERAFHWSFALPFLGLLLSGLPLGFPALRSWIDGYTPEIGMRLHLACGVALFLLPGLVIAFGDRKALRATASDLFTIARHEYAWLGQLPRWLAGLSCRMEHIGKFNAGQKANARLVAAASLLLATTGILLWVRWQWPGGVVRGHGMVRTLVDWSGRLHLALTLFILAPLAGHILLATVHPRTKASFRGMLFGVVDGEWAREHHPAWYVEACRKERAVDGPADSRPPGREREGA
jgi:formate dehydrogenase subunit gamma